MKSPQSVVLDCWGTDMHRNGICGGLNRSCAAPHCSAPCPLSSRYSAASHARTA
eukprot:CAMPEP_0118951950 /NCGR_PEP_ID=MMETSP1169-20130426/53971_1 /TAXON_ID=36882 /ORGANISM="Pyramimonas obovata, Strain CCMP722" /LENGTH=53 /DNA_ID=CAMNT_0006899097 /DNA_START=190 /DNA_END=347 /DNA_ORIENTATION=+